VGATTFRLNAQNFEPALHGAIHSASRYSTVRLPERHEDISAGAARPRLQIAQDRLSDFVLKGIALISAASLGHVSKVAMKRKLPSSGTMDGVEMLTVSTPFIAQLRSVALVVRDSNDNGGRA
jgi:hypothetical protein